MRVWGLTGGIGSGKSTVSSMFRELGFPVVDADTVAREVVGPGQPALAQVAARFPGVVTADGALDRAQLAARIFADPSERIALNAITHPAIAAAVRARLQALAEAGESHAIYDAALLIENRLHETLDGVILVTAPVELQRARLAARNHLPPEVAEARIASQLPLSAKRPHARWVVDNGGTIEATRAQVEHVAAQLRALAGA